jgi:hypothetical protein
MIKIFSFPYSSQFISPFASMYSEILTAAVHKKIIEKMKEKSNGNLET